MRSLFSNTEPSSLRYNSAIGTSGFVLSFLIIIATNYISHDENIALGVGFLIYTGLSLVLSLLLACLIEESEEETKGGIHKKAALSFGMILFVYSLPLIFIEKVDVINTLYGISLNKPFTNEQVETLKVRGMNVSAVAPESKSYDNWDYAINDPVSPNTTFLVHLDSNNNVVKIEVLLCVKVECDPLFAGDDAASQLFNALVEGFSSQMDWSIWEEYIFNINYYRSYDWGSIEGEVRPLMEDFSAWNDGKRALLVYYSERSIDTPYIELYYDKAITITLQDTQAMKAMYKKNIEEREFMKREIFEAGLKERDIAIKNKIHRFMAPEIN